MQKSANLILVIMQLVEEKLLQLVAEGLALEQNKSESTLERRG